MNKKPLIIIAGPTACGKTALSIELAKKLDTEIISADSMQIYKYMDIGTAKPSIEEMQNIQHHLIDELEPDEYYSVSRFQQMAKERMDNIYNKGKIPIVVGGTGFYINALIYNNDFSEEQENDHYYRNELEALSKLKGKDFVYDMLKDVDPESAKNIHINNTKRVIRALEYYKLTGKKMSEHNTHEKQRESYYDTKLIILNTEREILYDRINKRIDKMLDLGLIQEVKELLDKGYNRDLVSMQGLGYKEIAAYLCGEYTLNEAIEILKRDTRRFAKRQITWFKHQLTGEWLDINMMNNTEMVTSILQNI